MYFSIYTLLPLDVCISEICISVYQIFTNFNIRCKYGLAVNQKIEKRILKFHRPRYQGYISYVMMLQLEPQTWKAREASGAFLQCYLSLSLSLSVSLFPC